MDPKPFFVFILLCRLSEDSLRRSIIPYGNPSKNWQWSVVWYIAGFEPGTVGVQSSVSTMNQHYTLILLAGTQEFPYWDLGNFFYLVHGNTSYKYSKMPAQDIVKILVTCIQKFQQEVLRNPCYRVQIPENLCTRYSKIFGERLLPTVTG